MSRVYFFLNSLFLYCKSESKNINEMVTLFSGLFSKCILIYLDKRGKCRKIHPTQVASLFSICAREQLSINMERMNLVDDCIVIIYSKAKDRIYASNKVKFNLVVISDSLDRNSYQEVDRNFRITCNLNESQLICEKIMYLSLNERKAKEYIHNNMFIEACICYERVADICMQLDLYGRAMNFFAYAALGAERAELWRRISFNWYRAATIHKSPNKSIDYTDFNTLNHTYPSISYEKWLSFSDGEKKARALQYAAYSQDNYFGPRDSYWLYFEAAKSYCRARIYSRAYECLVFATNRYSSAYHKISDELLEFWKIFLRQHADELNLDNLIVTLEYIYQNLGLYDSEQTKLFYLEANRALDKKAIIEKSYLKYLVRFLWRITTNYGTGVKNLLLFATVIITIVFPIFLSVLHVGENVSFTSYIIMSVNMFFGLYQLNDLNGLENYIYIIQTLFSYMILVIISTYLFQKFIRKF